jgi:hypothetical protein
VLYLLENQPRDAATFDRYYSIKHEHATRKLIEEIKNSLTEMGLPNVHVVTELPTDMGVNDIVIVAGSPVRLFSHGDEIIRIELKASEGFDFEQLDRYMLDLVPLILARIPTGQVAYLDPEKIKEYATFSANQQIPKIQRLLKNEPITVSGRWCEECPDLQCPVNKNHGLNKTRFVQVPPAIFNSDITSHFTNLPGVIREVVELAVGLLRSRLPQQA